MAIKVTPGVVIDGQAVACTVDALDDAPVAVEGLEIDWGRSEYGDPSTDPASLTMTLLDATDTWAARIRESRAVGLTVSVTWTAHPLDPGGIAGRPVTMFRGRIQKAVARPLDDRRTDDGRRRWRIVLTVADRTADLGNAIAGPEPWERETMLSRAIKVRDLGLAGGSGIEQVYFWPGYQSSWCAPLDVKNKSALTLIAELYESMGNDSYAYDPADNVVRQAIRLSQPMTVHLGAFDDDLGAVYPVPNDIDVDGVTYVGVSLGGCELEGVPEVVADPATDINRLECSWEDQLVDHGDVKTVIENVDPGDARRVMAWSSWFDDGIVIDPTLANVWERVREEGRRPRHPDITTRPTHVFPTNRLALWTLQTWENTRPAYIAGSLAYQWLLGAAPAYSPVVAPIGGTTTFDPVRGWSTTMHVHWIHNSAASAASASWSSLRQVRTTYSTPSVPWWYALLGIPAPAPVPVGSPTPERDLTWGEAAAEAGYRFADSVTWGDLRHVPDTGTQIIDHLD